MWSHCDIFDDPVSTRNFIRNYLFDMTIFYTSDTHYGHKNILMYSKRPFKDVEEMNYQMIKRWNEVISYDDTVYHLGDFSFSRDSDSIAAQLNGNLKFIILGNHDKKPPQGFIRKEQLTEIYDGDTKIILSHYGMRVWNQSHCGSICLFGHSHGSLPGTDQSLDVGVDCWDYYPITLEQIKRRLKTLPKHGVVDHHGQR